MVIEAYLYLKHGCFINTNVLCSNSVACLLGAYPTKLISVLFFCTAKFLCDNFSTSYSAKRYSWNLIDDLE
ncbi:hypothetical protein QVD17_20825 [Tagetes erecta]|uniref:Uncharacterized protein n=1 Tax=Tagetes erecta TaxID=13708 RepID=A0AAD8KME1_TARER|nr:hypothetical protein QVD17_20825 [Tagetes erecta]